MEKLSKEELIQLLTLNKVEVPKKARKKADLDAEKKAEMLERLERMRAVVAENRKVKKTENEEVTAKNPPSDIFEKRYESKFDKMTELLTTLNENTKAVADLKREKKEVIQKEKADKLEQDRLKKENFDAMKKLQEEQLEIARTQQYSQQQHQPQPQKRIEPQPLKNVEPNVVGGQNLNPLAKFIRPKPQLW